MWQPRLDMVSIPYGYRSFQSSNGRGRLRVNMDPKAFVYQSFQSPIGPWQPRVKLDSVPFDCWYFQSSNGLGLLRLDMGRASL